MKLDISSVLGAIQQVGAATPAFRSLFNQVLPLFGSADQARLKNALEEARARSDAAHDDLQRAARGE